MKKLLLLFVVHLTFFQSGYAQAGSVCWREVSAGQNFTLAIKNDGTLWGWGQNGNLLGLNGNMANQSLPIQIGTANDWMSVSAGANHSLAVKTTGTLWAWGSGVFGQLGNGAFNNATWTVTQLGIANDWLKVSAGSAYSLAIKNTGTLWAWGLNNTGQLGIGNTTNQNSPIQVGTSNAWSKIEAGNEHALAIDNLGFVWSWGNNTFGQLGDGTNTTSLSPIIITSSGGWTEVSAGFDHSLFLNGAQFLFSCGNNTNGQLCNGTNTPSNILIPATATGSQFRYIAISAGQTHSMAIKDDFTFWTAGFNNQGQLGLGNFANTNALNQVGTGTNWFFVSAGFVHSHALETSTDLWSAGRGLEGQLGVGSFTNSNVIVIVTCPTTPLSIQDNVLKKFEVNVYPNPTKGLATITYNLINDAAITIRLTNIQGQILQQISSQKLSGIQTENIDLGALSNGIYFLSITNANATYSAKLIKK